MSSNTIKIKAGSGTPTTSDIQDKELAFDRSADKLYINDAGTIVDLTGTASSGDIEGVTAGNGLTGGGTSGTVTLNHEDTSSQASVNNSGRTYIQDITLDTYGHVTAISSATETVTDTNTVTTNIAGTGVSVSSGTGNSTISIGQAVGTSDTVAFGRVNLGSTNDTTYLTGDSKLSIDGYIMANAIVNTPETGSGPAAITFGDGATLGSDQISLVTSGARRLYVASNGDITIAQNLTVNGTIGGSAIKDQDDMSSNSATHLATQQSIKAYVDAEVAGVVNSAPAALNTLDELAAALGDDANFATTTSTALGNRLRVDTASQGLTGTQQANAITNLGITATKAELNYVDGVTSNIQTQLDGKQASGSYLTSSSNLNASNLSSGTVNNARLNTDMQLSAAAPRYKLQETGVTNTPVWWMIADGGNYSIRLNNTGDYPISINTNSTNNAINDIDINYDIHLKATKKLFLDGGGNSYIQEESADNLIFRAAGGNYLRVTGSNIVLNDPGASYDVRIEGDTDSNLFFADGSADKIGIGTNAPYEKLYVQCEDATSPGIVSNPAATNGAVAYAIGYGDANRDYINTWGMAYSSGANVFGFGVKPSTTVDEGFINSADNANFKRGALYFDDELKFFNAGAQTGTIDTAITMTERFRVDSVGNVKVGSGSVGLSYASHGMEIAGSGDQSLRLEANGSTVFEIAARTGDVLLYNNGTARSLRFGVGGGEKFRINSDGNAYFYQTAVINGNNYSLSGRDTGGTVRTMLKIDTGNSILLGDGNLTGQVHMYPQTYAQINTNYGYLQIGPQNTSHCHYTTDRSNHWFNTRVVIEGGVLDSYNEDLTLRRASSNNDRITIEADQHSHYVNGTKRLEVKGNGTVQVNGTLNATADVVAYFSSDKRLKDNLKLIENPLDKVSKLSGYEFDWNDKQKTYQGHDIGVVAQEVEEVLPELVATREDGYKAVKYEKIVPLLIEAIKEQQQQINELKEKLNG
jgi:hypothetical protein